MQKQINRNAKEKDLNYAGKQESGLYVETTHKRGINMRKHSTATENVKSEYTWLGDNLGGEGEVFIDAKSDLGCVCMSLEQALYQIDRFVAKSQNRILSAINFHFGLGEFA